MDRQKTAEKVAGDMLTAEEKTWAKRLLALQDLKQQERDALDAVRPQAEAKLTQLQERADLAHEVRAERQRLQKKEAEEQVQERVLTRGRDRSLGLSR